ncbi:hypothetical protein GALL_489060 [mine drainage metagenome]|uniref:Uncharacterized protein n=1 Tax=mine drainage metagenome TaxID=410659 RepID=A0A1J5PPI2_9ZZZZ
MLYPVISLRLRSSIRESKAPKPAVVLLPEMVISAKSANFAFTLPIAAHPPFPLKSVARNSSNQIIPDLAMPSSVLVVDEVFIGLRTPSIMVVTKLRSGWPTIVMVSRPSETLNGNVSGHGCPWYLALLRASLALVNFVSVMSSSFAAGHMALGSAVPGSVTCNGISYS